MKEYADFELHIKESKPGHYIVSTPGERGGYDDEQFTLALTEEQIKELQNAMRGRRSAIQASAIPKEFGRQLFNAIFQGRVRDRFRKLLDDTGRLRIRLNIESPFLMGLPWEFLHEDMNFGNFLALSHDTVITRYARGKDPHKPPYGGLVPPLRILGMVSLPRDLTPLNNANEEKRRIEEALKDLIDCGRIWIDWLEEPTLEGLLRKLRTANREYHIFHFIGHGTSENGGSLFFENQDGNALAIDAFTLTSALTSQFHLRLAVLNACESAQSAIDTSSFASVATTLIAQGIPAVIAMQFAIRDTDAIHFANQVYQALASEAPVETVITDTRISLSNKFSVAWGIPVLYLGIPGKDLFPLSHNSRALEDQIRHLLQTGHWAEAVALGKLLETFDPFAQEKAQCLIALGQAHIYTEQQDWENVLWCCKQGLSLVQRGSPDSGIFQNLEKRASEEHKIAILLARARKDFTSEHFFQAEEICRDILNLRANEVQARAILQGIKVETHLRGYKKQLENGIRHKNWLLIQHVIEEALESVGTLDPQSAGVAFPEYAFFIDMRELAELYDKAMENLKKEAWVQAEGQLRHIYARHRDLCPQVDLLYAESRLLLTQRRKSEARVQLQQIQQLEPDYRDAAQLLQALIREDQEQGRLQQGFEEYFAQRKWTEALDLRKRLNALEGSEAGSQLSKNLEDLLAILPKLTPTLIADPSFQWPGGIPYEQFSDFGLSPKSSGAAVNNALYERQMQEQAISEDEQATWDHLCSVPQRLYLDAFFYSGSQVHKLVEFLESFMLQHRSLPTFEQIAAMPLEETPLLLLLLEQRQLAAQIWETRQRENLADTSIAHHLGLLYYWQAKANPSSYAWQKAIGNLVLALENEAYWQKWCEERGTCYGTSVAGCVEKLRQDLEAHFVAELAPRMHLSQTFHGEIAAARALSDAGGLPIPGSLFDVIACGPLMLHSLQLEAQLARFVATDERTRPNTNKAGNSLRRYFSQCCAAAVFLDQDQPEQALDALKYRDNSACPTRSTCTTRSMHAALSGIYCETCSLFDQANPGYRRLPERGKVLRDDAVEIALTAHLRLAEQSVIAPTSALNTPEQHWREAVKLARLSSKGAARVREVSQAITELALGRARFLLQKVDKEEDTEDTEDAEDFSWYEEVDRLCRLVLDIVGASNDVFQTQANALASRGVRRANILSDPVGAESDLRKAFELYPTSIHILEKLVWAKKLFALFAQQQDRTRAHQILDEALQFARFGLRNYPDRQYLRDLLEDIKLVQESWRVGEEGAIPDTIKDLEQQIQLSPQDKALQDDLFSELTRYSEKLFADGQRDLAVALLEQRLPLFSDQSELRNHIGFIREGYKVRGYLKATDLNFREVVLERANRTFLVPFRDEDHHSSLTDVLVDVFGSIATISIVSPWQPDITNIQMLRSYLEIFQSISSYKSYYDSNTSKMFIALEMPVSLLSPRNLEGFIRTVKAIKSLEEIKDLLNNEGTFFEHFYGFASLSPHDLPTFCSQTSIICEKQADRIWSLRRQADSPKITVSYSSVAVHFSISAGELREVNSETCLRLAILNNTLHGCKIALNEHQHVDILCELPQLNGELLRSALARLEAAVIIFHQTSLIEEV